VSGPRSIPSMQADLERKRRANGIGVSEPTPIGATSPIAETKLDEEPSDTDDESDAFEALAEIQSIGDAGVFGAAIPEGDYGVSYLRHDLVFMKMFRRRVFVCHFTISTPGEHLGRHLLRFVNEPKPGKRLARSSTVARDWMAIIKLRAPARSFRFSPRALYGGGTELIAHVTTAKKMLGPGGKPVTAPEAARYSVINGFIGVAAGTPLLLQRRKTS
jgi:hypothetical protein